MDDQKNAGATQTSAGAGRSEHMETAALILGMTAVLTSPCIYAALICGSLGILFALLSKGGKMTAGRRGKTGLILSGLGLALTVAIYAGALYLLLEQYGGLDGLMQEYRKLYESGSLEELYQSMGVQPF